MKNRSRIAEIIVFAVMMFIVTVGLQYILEVNGITRAYHQWWTNWSGINFTGLMDYLYGSKIYHVYAWMMTAVLSGLFGIFAGELYGMRFD